MSRRWLIALALVAAPLGPVRADDAEPRNFSVERFHLAPDRNGLFDVDWAEHPGSGAIDAALAIGLVDDPLVVYRDSAMGDRMVVGALVSTRATADLLGSIVVHRALSIGADLPLVIYQDRPQNSQIAPNGLESLSSFGLGNLRLVPKLTVATEDRHGIGVAVLAALTLPTESMGDAYLGDHGVSVAPTVALSKRFGAWSTGLNLGYLARKRARLLDLVVDDEVFSRAGVGYDLSLGRPIRIDVTMSAVTATADFGGHLNINHLEGLVGATVQVDPQVQLFGGVGAGLSHGFGTPDARAMLGVRLTRGGGVEPRKPVELDRDHDGILDVVDRCPAQPEDKDGFEDDDGCPDPDNDKDGVLDVADRCPIVPGVEANQGCPDTDADGDTVVDRLDRCPTEIGPPDNNGCPQPQKLVTIGDDKLEIVESVYFKLDSAIIEPRSFELLDNVATVLAAHGALVIRVEGHTDSQGDDAYNLELSQRRAQAVVDYLVGKGVERARLQAQGFGETKPIANNRTRDGRAQNRRVVFTIIGANKQQGADESTREPAKEAPKEAPKDTRRINELKK